MSGALLAIWQADSAFPSGAFAFSNGLEGLAAIEGALPSERLASVIEGALRRRWATADRVALLKSFDRADDLDAVVDIDHEIEAATLSEPFRLGSRRNGASLLASHVRLGTPGAAEWRSRVRAGDAPGHLPTTQSVVWRGAGLDRDGAVAASGYMVVSGFATAAVRLGLVGAVAAQSVVRDMLTVIDELSRREPPKRIESFAPLLDVAAARHARGALRLFSN